MVKMVNCASDLQYPPPPPKKNTNKNPHRGKVVSDIMAPRFRQKPMVGWVNRLILVVYYTILASSVVTGDDYRKSTHQTQRSNQPTIS